MGTGSEGVGGAVEAAVGGVLATALSSELASTDGADATCVGLDRRAAREVAGCEAGAASGPAGSTMGAAVGSSGSRAAERPVQSKWALKGRRSR